MELNGREIAGYLKQRHFEQVKKMKRAPALAIIQVGEDPASSLFIKVKERYGRDIGAKVAILRPPAGDLIKVIKSNNADPGIDGVIVQLPLPNEQLTKQAVKAIDPAKDVDGLGPDSQFDPATPKAILWLLASYQVQVKGKTVAVVGQGRLVGQPLAKMLKNSGAKVLTADEDTADLAAVTLPADIIVLATGQKHLLRPGMAKTGAVIIDCGSPNPEADPALLNDPTLKITPVPGGVGPMTVACLWDNLLISAQKT